ncbi:MAG: hypothetical protein ACQET5_13905 [Halobacteriota archaeon]
MRRSSASFSAFAEWLSIASQGNVSTVTRLVSDIDPPLSEGRDALVSEHAGNVEHPNILKRSYGTTGVSGAAVVYCRLLAGVPVATAASVETNLSLTQPWPGSSASRETH